MLAVLFNSQRISGQSRDDGNGTSTYVCNGYRRQSKRISNDMTYNQSQLCPLSQDGHNSNSFCIPKLKLDPSPRPRPLSKLPFIFLSEGECRLPYEGMEMPRRNIARSKCRWNWRNPGFHRIASINNFAVGSEEVTAQWKSKKIVVVSLLRGFRDVLGGD